MRPGLCARCVSSILKLLIFFQAFAGVSLLIYSAWVLDRWNRHAQSSTPSWFGYGMLGVGVAVFAIALLGHISAEALSACCLCFYMVLATVLMLLEAALVAFMALDKHWEEDLPRDSTGELEKLRAFIEANIDVFKWVGLAMVIIQVLSLFFAIILWALVSPRRGDYDSDDDFTVIRQPLLHPQYSSNPVLGSIDCKGIHSDVWSSRMKQKYGLNQGDRGSGAMDPRATPLV